MAGVGQIPARDSQPVCPGGWQTSRLYLQQPLEEKDLITTWNIHNSSVSGGFRQSGRQQEVYGSLLWFYRCSYVSQTHSFKNTHTVFWDGPWVEKTAWCLSFSPLRPDQTHEAAAKDDVTIPQLSLPLSASLKPWVCVWERGRESLCARKSSNEVKSLAVSFPLILSSLKTLGILHTALKAVVWIMFPSLCMRATHAHKPKHTHAHRRCILQFMLTGIASVGEWEREGKKRKSIGTHLQQHHCKWSNVKKGIHRKQATHITAWRIVWLCKIPLHSRIIFLSNGKFLELSLQ